MRHLRETASNPETGGRIQLRMFARAATLRRPGILLAAAIFSVAQHLHAQVSDPKAEQALIAATQAELAAARDDHSVWIYRDHDVSLGKDDVLQVVDTPEGGLRRLILHHGQPLTPVERDAESVRIDKFVNDPSEQAHQRKAGEHDDVQAEEMTKMLPTAFVWTIASETPEFITLNYQPNPHFDPPDMEAHVMGTMAGQMIIARNGNRIRTLRGTLTEDVKIGFGILGRLKQGGTFDIERRQVAPGLWQITESHVHIDGHALLFKTIGQQDDEVKTDWKPSPAHTLREAEDILRNAK